MKRTNLFRFLTIIVLLFAASFAQAATYYVATTGNDANPGTQAQPFRTIARGIATAASGDTVLVAAGTYAERFRWEIKSLILKGAGAGQSIIDGGGAGTCLRLYNVPSTARIEGFTIQNGFNDVGGGGGMFMQDSSVTVTCCTFSNNMCNTYFVHGGGMFNYRSNPTLSNCVFRNNASNSGRGGGMYNRSSSPTVTNCTFNGNYAMYGGSGISTVEGDPIVTNCIVWDGDFSSIDAFLSTTTVSHSNVQGGYAGTGNINADPRFVNAAAGNYRLQVTSPCLNTGSASASGLPATDMDGVPRILGSAPDMGA
jgi:hypothetical protein